MIAKIKRGWKKRKVKLFSIFLFCSFSAWFISNLSETYTSNTTFELNFVGVPENKMLISASKEKLDIKLEAVGFQFLGFTFNQKAVAIDLSEVVESKGHYFVAENQYRKQIEKQLSSAMRLVQILDDTLFFELKEVVTKELPVELALEMTFEQNYFLDGQVAVEPATISVTGPINELDTILRLRTKKIELTDLSSDFSRDVAVIKPDSLANSDFSGERVTLSGTVSRFSEKIIKVPVGVTNLPENMIISTFPEEVEVLCKGKLSDLKNISYTDFRVVGDYTAILEGNGNNRLPIEIQMKPNAIFGASLVQKQVAYILKKK